MSADRISWRDVQRAAEAFAEALRRDGFITDAHLTFHVSPGSVTNGYAADLYWHDPTGVYAHTPAIPGGCTLARSARDSYDNLTTRTRMVDNLRTMHANGGRY